MLTRTDVAQLVIRLQSSYDLSGGEMCGSIGIEYLEGLVHEMGHVMDLGVSVPSALELAGRLRGIGDTIRSLETYEAMDANEVNTTAITVLTLHGFAEGYHLSLSEDTLFQNTKGNKDAITNAYLEALDSSRLNEIAATIRSFLLCH